MATGLQSWSKTAASNASADSNVNWAEGMAPSAVNDSSRGEMASAAKWRDDISGTITTTGSSTAYAITTNQGFATAAAMSGAMLTFIPHATSGASPTLAVDGLTARAINKSTGVAVATGSLIVGTPYTVTYIHATTEFILRDYTEVMGSPTFTGNLTVNGTSTLTGAVTLSAACKAADGTVALPEYSFTSDLDCGMYRIGANNLGIAVNGAKVIDIATTGLTVTGALSATTTLSSTSDFAVNTSKFTVDAATGNTVVAGTLAPAGNVTGAAGIKSSSPSVGVGYATGAGGAVTQSTNKSTTVSLNTVVGAVTMNNASLASNTLVTFALSNSSIASGDLIIVNHVSGGTAGNYSVAGACGVGGATITVRNVSGGGLSDALLLVFAVIKGVTS